MLDPKIPKLIVVGAGVGGVTTAIEAAKFQIPTVILEREVEPFSRQAECTTRFIDPTQYDWPVDIGLGKISVAR